MAPRSIQQAVKSVRQFYSDHPEKALSTDSIAVARVEEKLRCRVEGPDGAEMISDMPRGIGGDGSAPTPGWFLRAALASCDATMIAMRAAEMEIELSRLEVAVESRSDDRGLIGPDESVPAGPLEMSVRVTIWADGVPDATLREIVEWAERHSPVGDGLRRAIPYRMEIVSLEP